jgi:hypothetical protein
MILIPIIFMRYKKHANDFQRNILKSTFSNDYIFTTNPVKNEQTH